jgi:hypothetical protein
MDLTFSDYELLSESLNSPALFTETEDTDPPRRWAITFEIDGITYGADISESTGKRVYMTRLYRVLNKKVALNRFKNRKHAVKAMSTLLYYINFKYKEMMTRVDGVVIMFPRKLNVKQVRRFIERFMQRLKPKHFNYVPVSGTTPNTTYEYAFAIKKGINPQKLFKGKQYSQYDFSGAPREEIPAELLDELKPKRKPLIYVSNAPRESVKFGKLGYETEIEFENSDVKDVFSMPASEKFKELKFVPPEKKKSKIENFKERRHNLISQLDAGLRAASQLPIGMDQVKYIGQLIALDTDDVWKLIDYILKSQEKHNSAKHESLKNGNSKYGRVSYNHIHNTDEVYSKGRSLYIEAQKNHLLTPFAYKIKELADETDLNDPEFVGLVNNSDWLSKFHMMFFMNVQEYMRMDFYQEVASFIYNENIFTKQAWENFVNNAIKKLKIRIADEDLELEMPGDQGDIDDSIRPSFMAPDNFSSTESLPKKADDEFNGWTDEEFPSLRSFRNTYAIKDELSGNISTIDKLAGDSVTSIKGVKAKDYYISLLRYTDHYHSDINNPMRSNLKITTDEDGSQFTEESLEKYLELFYHPKIDAGTQLDERMKEKNLSNSELSIYKDRRLVLELFAMMDPIPSGRWIYRGSYLPTENQKDVVPGTVIGDTAFQSMSGKFGGWGSNLQMAIYLPKGSRILPVFDNSEHSNEEEILLPPMSTHKVMEVSMVPSSYSGVNLHVTAMYMGSPIFDLINNKAVLEEGFTDERKYSIMKLIRESNEKKNPTKKYDPNSKFSGKTDLNVSKAIENLAKKIRQKKLKRK